MSRPGLKSWRWKYRIAGREKTLTFGSYPELKLTAARDTRDDARQAHRQGLDPSQARQQEKEARAREAAATFETIARRCVVIHSLRGKVVRPRFDASTKCLRQSVCKGNRLPDYRNLVGKGAEPTPNY